MRRRGQLFKAVLAVSAWCVPAAMSLGGQDEAQRRTDPFEEAVEVQLVNLEVVVTNREDERVAGLERDEFVVRVDGIELPILYFSEIGAEEADRQTGARPVGPPVNFLVFVDDHVSLSRNRDLTLERLREELPLLRPDDRMAIVAYDGRKISVLSPWTHDSADLDQALADAIERPSIGIRWVALQRNPSFVANWIGNASRRSILAAGSSMRLLPRPQGRKVMLLVAGSWDPREVRAAENFSPWCPSGPCNGNYVFWSLTDAANELGYSIYAVDVEGRDVQQSWWREQRLQQTLGMLARQTGGLSLLNGDRRHMLSIASADSRTYYSIGIQPEAALANSRHRIEVEVLRADLDVRARESFVATSDERRQKIETFSAVLGDVDASAPSFPVQLGEIERLRGRRMSVPVAVFAPAGELTWLPAGRLFRARLEVGLATLDVYGNSTVETHRFVLEQASPAVVGEAEHLEFVLRLKRRQQTLAVVVRDLQGDGSFTTLLDVEPPTGSSAGAGTAEPAGEASADVS